MASAKIAFRKLILFLFKCVCLWKMENRVLVLMDIGVGMALGSVLDSDQHVG